MAAISTSCVAMIIVLPSLWRFSKISKRSSWPEGGSHRMNWERFGIKIEKQLHTTPLVSFSIPLLAILLALLVEGVFLFISGYNPFGVYGVLFKGAFGTWYGLSESIVTAIPLILTGLGVSIAFRMVLWNIGGEGQLYMGAFAASWVALSYPDAPAYILQPAMFMAGFTGGALWGLIPAIPRALKGVNETLTTLMLNYVAIFRSIAENNQLGTAQAVLVRGSFRGLLDHFSHLINSFHVDA
jgi:hypothetical protein